MSPHAPPLHARAPHAAAAYSHRLIAGWLSLLVHLVVLLTGALWLRATSLPALEEPGREVGIVLAAPGAASPPEVEYYDEATSDAFIASPTEASAGSLNPVDATGDESHPSASLPAETPPMVASRPIDLPGNLPALADPVTPGVANVAGGVTGAVVIDPTAGKAEILAEEARRPRAAAPHGPPGEVNVFGSGGEQGHSFVFVIDRSQSMGSQGLGAIAAAQLELLAALDQLQSNHQFQVIAYNQGVTYLRGRKLLTVDAENRQACRTFLENLAAFGATNHIPALMSALQMQPDVLYLLTDGDPELTPAQRRRIREENRGGTKICCIQFGRHQPVDEATRTALQALARENGGSYTFIDMSSP